MYKCIYRYFFKLKFVGVNRWFVLIYSNHDANAKRLHHLTKDAIKNLNIIINRKNFYDQPIYSDIKRYEEIS